MKKIIKTKEILQPQDKREIEVYSKATQLKEFKIGHKVSFKDRQDLIVGTVGGFSMHNVEILWILLKDQSLHTRHRADEITFIKDYGKVKADKTAKSSNNNTGKGTKSARGKLASKPQQGNKTANGAKNRRKDKVK